MTAHDLRVIPIPPEYLAPGVAVWRCIRCAHVVVIIVRAATPQDVADGYATDGRTVWYHVAVQGDRDADHTAAARLASDQLGLQKLQRLQSEGAA